MKSGKLPELQWGQNRLDGKLNSLRTGMDA